MKRLALPALAAALFAFAPAPGYAETAFISGTGEYVWNPATSHYGTPPYAKTQTMSIAHDDGKTVKLSQNVTLADGKTFTWGYDGAYDGKPHPGDWITIALKRIKPDAFSNDYTMNDGSKGHEVATISADKIVIEGDSVDPKGAKQHYVEVWDKTK